MDLTDRQRKRVYALAQQSVDDCMQIGIHEMFAHYDEIYEKDYPYVTACQFLQHLYMHLIECNIARCFEHSFEYCEDAARFLARKYEGVDLEICDITDAKIKLKNLRWRLTDEGEEVNIVDCENQSLCWGFYVPYPFYPAALAIIDEVYLDVKSSDVLKELCSPRVNTIW